MGGAGLSYKELKTEVQFLKMVLANVISRFGDSVDLIAFQWIVYQITRNPVWIAVIGGVNFLPNLLFMPFTGVFAERLNKRRVMMICDIGRAVMTLAVVGLWLKGMLNPWVLMMITFSNSTLESFRIPAGATLRPRILTQDKYTMGMAMDASLSRIAELIGFAMAGMFVAISPVFAIIVDGVTFLLSAVVIGTITYTELPVTGRLTPKSFFGKLKEGGEYLNRKRILLYLAIFGAAMNIGCNPIDSFRTIYLADYLKLGAGVLSAVSVASTLGMSFGAFMAPKIKSVISGRKIYGIIGIGYAVNYLLLAMLPGSGFSSVGLMVGVVAVLALNGAVSGVIDVIYCAAFYSRIDEEYVGRVGGVFGSMTVASIPLSSFLFAGLSSFLSIPAIFLIGGCISLVIYMSVFFIKEFKEL